MDSKKQKQGTGKQMTGSKRSSASITRSKVRKEEEKKGRQEPIATFVFLELETTGLLTEQGGKTKITEICLYAVKREDLCTDSESDPRVINELTMCFDPVEHISPKASSISGLSNPLLRDQTRFDKNSVSVINGFLRHLPEPRCLIAHNGNKFDYPLLQLECNKVQKSFLQDLYCADSLPAYRKKQPHLVSYKLKDIYMRLFPGKPQPLYSAKRKCVAIAKCAKVTPGFCDWVESNKRLLSQIRPYC